MRTRKSGGNIRGGSTALAWIGTATSGEATSGEAANATAATAALQPVRNCRRESGRREAAMPQDRTFIKWHSVALPKNNRLGILAVRWIDRPRGRRCSAELVIEVWKMARREFLT
jgi:hypothetical protein